MSKQCPNPQCHKSDNSDNATLCYKCGTPLPRSAVGRLPGPANAAKRFQFGPSVQCLSGPAGGQPVSVQGSIVSVVAEPKIIQGPSSNPRLFGIGFVIIRGLTVLGSLAVVGSILGGVHAFGFGGVLGGIIVGVLGVIAVIVFYKLASWIWRKFIFIKFTLSGPGDISPRLLTRVLSVRESSDGNGRALEVVLSSTRHADLAMPKVGDHIDLQGVTQGRRVIVRSYRIASPR